MAAEHSEDVFHHVRDSESFELPGFLGGELRLPEIPFLPSPSKALQWVQGERGFSEVWGLQLTKFMLLQVLAGLLVFLIYRGLAKRIGSGEPTRGRWWNFWEALALFIRDEVVRPTIGDPHHHEHGVATEGDGSAVGGHSQKVGDVSTVEPAGTPSHEQITAGHPADKYLPFVWSCFFYVLFANLLGAFPWMGSATGNINVTGVLALTAFGVVVLAGSRQSGPIGFWLSLAPSMDVPAGMKLFLFPMIWVIELAGLLIKHCVLAVRLFANIMGGHTVIAVILGFIAATAASPLFWVVAPASILGQVAIGLLELLVAFIQAYIFAFLATLFISSALHPH